MQNSIICTNCKCEMHLIKNWNTAYTGDVQNTYFETFTIFAYRLRNAFTKGTGFKKIKPRLFVCNNCGKMEMYINKSDLTTIMSVEHDEDYTTSVKNNFSNNIENDNSVNLTRISRLKQRAQERKVGNSYE